MEARTRSPETESDYSLTAGLRKKAMIDLRKAKDMPERLSARDQPRRVVRKVRLRDAATLDEIDRRVIAALQTEGRRAFSSIAEELEISESVVRYRVQRLEEAGILQVVGIADPLKIGFDLMAMVGLRVQPGTIHEVCSDLQQLPETSYVAAVAGRYDVLVELVCRDTAHFQQILNDGLHRIVGVTSTESFLILEIHKMAYGWGVGDHGVPLADTSSSSTSSASSKPAASTTTTAKPSARSAKKGTK